MLPGQENAATEPLQPIKSGRSRKTPQPELPPQRSSRRTPRPEKTQLQRSLGRTPATGVAKKRGRPAKTANSDGPEDLSTSRLTQADEEGNPTKKTKTSKTQKERRDAVVSTAPEIEVDGLGTTEAAPSAARRTGVKKRKKRKSIGQQSTSRAKAAKAQSLRKPARLPRKRVPKQDLAEATEAIDLDETLAKGVQKGTLFDAVPLGGVEPAHLPEFSGVLDSGIDTVKPNAGKPQQELSEKPKKRKRVPVGELPKKRVKTSSAQSKRAPKAPQTQKKITPTEDVFDAVQSTEKPIEVYAGLLGDVNEEQEAASEAAEPRKENPKKRKRVTVGRPPKKRAKVDTTKSNGGPKSQEETSTAEDAAEANLGKAAEVEADSVGHVAERSEATTTEGEPQTQKPKRKKRKSIGQQKPKKKSMDLATPNRTAGKAAASGQLATRDKLSNKPIAKRGRPRAIQPPEEVNEEPEAENLGHVSEEEEKIQSSEPGPSKPKARRGRPKAKPVSEDAVHEPNKEAWRHALEEEEAQAPVLPQKKKRGRPRKADAAQPPSQTTKPTKAPASRKPIAKLASTKARAPLKNSIPITIYTPPSPTSSDAEDDPLTTSQPHPTTNTINAVDVLSQLCSELLSKSSSTLAEQIHSSDASNQSGLKRTKQTTDRYAEELASRLLQLTTTLNTNTSLQSRVRAAAKEERSLKKELKALEKEREDIKVRKEQIMKEKKKRELENLLSGIAGAVKRGWDMQKEGEAGDAVAGMVEEMDLEV